MKTSVPNAAFLVE